MSLTDKQKAFIAEYVKDYNATQAAIRAGYSEDSASNIGYENLTKPDIQAAIKLHMQGLGATAERVVAELMKVAFADIVDYVDIDEAGAIKVKMFSEMPDGASRAISEVSEDCSIKELPDGAMLRNSKVKIKHHDKLKALELLGKHLGVFNDKLTVNGDPTAPIQVTFVKADDKPPTA